MNLLTRAVVSKLINDNAKTEFSCGKLSVSPSFNGTCTVRFPIMFTPYKTVGVEAVAKKFGPETGYAAIGIELKRNGAFFCRDARMGKFLLDGDNYRQYNLRFFIPFGVNEAYITLECERGATVSVLSLSSQTDGYTGAADAEVKYIADGGMSAYAPKNTMPAFLAAMRAGFRSIIADVCVTADGELVCNDGKLLSASSDGEGFAKDLTLQQLKALDFGMYRDSFYKNTRITTLKEALMQFAGDGITPYIRIRGDEFPADKLKAEIDALGIEEVFVMAESAAVRKEVARAVDGVKFAFPSKFFSDGEDRVTAEQYEAMRESGAEIIPLVNYPEEMERFVKSGEKQLITAVYMPGGYIKS